MKILSNKEVSEICKKLGKSSPKNIKQVMGGDIHESWQIEFENKKFFLKRNTREKELLKFEDYCLRKLVQNINSENLIIPKVISYLKVNNTELLLMDWIDMQNGDQKKLGKGLGEMHLKSAESHPKMFGYPVEGYIGCTNQKKGWENNWIDCFLNLRIKPQLSILDSHLIEIKIKEKLIEKIKLELINHKPVNALVHGDLWSGNKGIDKKGRGVIFDPASWWADTEVDIAMTKLFGGFKTEFYEEYHKVIPAKDGIEKRELLYNFYHILNHANMFGGSYINDVYEYINKILSI